LSFGLLPNAKHYPTINLFGLQTAKDLIDGVGTAFREIASFCTKIREAAFCFASLNTL
jgi:hypothetical protein